MLVTINRNIFQALPKELSLEYIENVVLNEYGCLLTGQEFKDASIAMHGIISSNEKYHQDHGKLRRNGRLQVDEDCMVPGFSEPSGYRTVGYITICPFDWSWDDNDDFDYTFFLARSIQDDT